MKTSRKRTGEAAAFWDASALVPLCCFQPFSSQARQAGRICPQQVVWWGTSVEVVSALHRLVREGVLLLEELQQANTRLQKLRQVWNEILPNADVRDLAESLLARHKLRTGDAFQLAAALTWCSGHPRDHHFVGADNDLLKSAAAEGFTTVRLK